MQGSVTFVTMVVILGLALLISYVGNMGAEILRRQRLQNAADSVAYSSALCMARGMNAICAYNHIMGELTSLVVILDALGGPESEDDRPFSTIEDTTVSISIAVLGEIPGVYFDGFSGGRFDKVLVDGVVKKVSDGWSGGYNMGEQHCGAAIYDAQYSLKKQIAGYLIAKVAGSALQLCKPIPIVGTALWLLGIADHIACNIQLGRIYPEMLILDILHRVVPKIAFIKTFIRDVLPYMCCIPEAIAGIGDPPMLGSVKHSLEQTQKGMKDFYQLELCVVNNRRLPVEREKEPGNNSGTQDKIVDDDDDDNDDDNTSDNPKEKNLKKKEGDDDEKLNESVTKAQKEINTILEKKKFLDEEKKKAAEQEREPFEVWTDEDEKRLEQARKALKKAELTRDRTKQIKQQKKAELANTLSYVASKFTKGNPSIDKLKSFDKEAEKKSQWVRASYPYINDIRNKLNTYFDAAFVGLTMCKMSKRFNKWVERYTLNESYCIRSGVARHDGDNEREPAFMLIMKDSTCDTKGKEDWTKNAETADIMFSLTAVVAQKNPSALMGKEIFKRGRKKSDIAVAQAMFYNANDCDTAKSSPNGCQPNISWDTLQWEPQGGFITAPECFNGKKNSGSFEIWNLFSSRKTESNDGSKVRLNWQSKLSPVTLNGFIKDAQIPNQIKQDCNIIHNNKDFLTH
jgi:hypothetical protein